jgi:ATP-binding cassette, subfamily B, bacterial
LAISAAVPTFDMKQAIAKNRIVGLWRIVRGYHLHYLGALMTLAVAAVAKTATLLLLRFFVDDVLPRDNVAQIVPLVALGFLGLALTEGGFTFLSGRLAAQTAESAARRLRNYLFDHVQRLSFSYHDKMQTGELLQRCTSDVDAMRRFFMEQGVGVGRIILLFTINMTAIMLINVPLALISVVVIPVVVAISIYFFKKVSARYEAFQEQEARLSTTLQENLSGVRVVKAFARQDYEKDKFEKENAEQYRLGRLLLIMHSYFWPITDLITGVQLLGGYFVGALLVMNGTLTIGDFMAYAGMIIWIIFPMRNMGRLIVQMSTGLVSYDRVMEVVRQEREPLGEFEKAPVDQLRGEVVFDDVWFEYEPNMPALRGISFRCEPGQTIALLGSTGSGKTSLVGLLPRFYDYTGGSIWLDGIELRDYPRRFLRANIGIVEQEPFLFSRTIRENITYGVWRDVPDEEVERAARAAAIHDVILTFPEGYSTLVGERGVTLSGGQKQRVALARTLLKNPKLLILDDATSSVDTETEASIRDALQELMEGRTTFIIAHRIQTIMHADLILVMDKGRIVQVGTHEELMREEGIYQRTYEMQSRIEAELEKEMAGD